MVEINDKLKLKNWNKREQYVYLLDYIHPEHRQFIGSVDPTYAPHAYEFQYLTDCEPYFAFNKSDTNAVELAFTKKLVDGMAQFVKTGNPATTTQAWPEVDDPIKVKYLQIGQTVAVNNTHFREIAKVWNKLQALGYGKPALI
jgi:carboxylesterase type B